MKKIILGSISVMLFCNVSFGQQDSLQNDLQKNDSLLIDSVLVKNTWNDNPVYKINPAVDIPLSAAGAGFSLYAFTKIYSKDSSTYAQINALRKDDVNSFDRWAAGKYSEKAANTSDLLFYGSMPLPLLLLIDKDIRKDAAKIGFLYFEALSVTGIFYTGTALLVDRYRPFAYNPDAPLSDRISGNAKNSFLGGHPALVATSTFFIAKVYADYHPESKIKWLFYSLASATTLTTVYLRSKAGKHFPSDLITGVTLGTLSGILVPHFHKHRLIKNKNISITPFTGAYNGFAMTWRF
jgi:membrane-associated phospholipid phosphatase